MTLLKETDNEGLNDGIPSGGTPTSIISGKLYFELFLFSLFVFVMSALGIQFFLTLQTAFLLNLFSINFLYSPFEIIFTDNTPGNWTLLKILIVFGAGFILFFIFGILTLLFRFKGWRINLVLIWTSFILVNSFPVGLLAGSFLFEGFGIAYTWMIKSLFSRVAIAILAIVVMMFTRKYWVKRFMKNAFSREFQKTHSHKQRFILNTMILPWIVGSAILVGFAYPLLAWYWMFVILGLGLLILPITGSQISSKRYLVVKSDKAIFPVPYPVVFVPVIIALLWMISWIRINF